jgi:hypothetical protein
MTIYITKAIGTHTVAIPLSVAGSPVNIWVTTRFGGIVQSTIDRVGMYNSTSRNLIISYLYTIAGDYSIDITVNYGAREEAFNDIAVIQVIPTNIITPVYSSQYISQQDLETYFAINGYPLNSVEHNTIYSQQKIQLHLDAATQLINGFLQAAGYSAPVKCPDGSIPSLLKQLILEEMDYRLHCSCLNEGRIFKYKQSLSIRDQIRRKTLFITCSDGSSLLSTVGFNKTGFTTINSLQAFKTANPSPCKDGDCGGCNGC